MFDSWQKYILGVGIGVVCLYISTPNLLKATIYTNPIFNLSAFFTQHSFGICLITALLKFMQFVQTPYGGPCPERSWDLYQWDERWHRCASNNLLYQHGIDPRLHCRWKSLLLMSLWFLWISNIATSAMKKLCGLTMMCMSCTMEHFLPARASTFPQLMWTCPPVPCKAHPPSPWPQCCKYQDHCQDQKWAECRELWQNLEGDGWCQGHSQWPQNQDSHQSSLAWKFSQWPLIAVFAHQQLALLLKFPFRHSCYQTDLFTLTFRLLNFLDIIPSNLSSTSFVFKPAHLYPLPI